MNELKLRIESLLQQLNERVFEKEHVVALSLLSAVAGESIFLLGPPGVAKSMVARLPETGFSGCLRFRCISCPVLVRPMKYSGRYPSPN